MKVDSRFVRIGVVGCAVVIAVVMSAGCAPKSGPAPTKSSTSEQSESATDLPQPSLSQPVVPGEVPTQVKDFAKKFSGPVWYPSKLPSGLVIDVLDVAEWEAGAGLVCDIFYLKGDTELSLIQGSPKTREYEIVSVGKVPWGTEQADVVYEDPTDTTSPKMIVYSGKGTLAELAGGSSFEELKGIAASMTLVK